MSTLTVGDDDVDRFLATIGQERPRMARLVFAIDATASRQPTWDHACHVQAQMFVEAGKLGGLEVQLVYYRGMNECRSSKWVSTAKPLVEAMTTVTCRAGRTQVAKVLGHVAKQHADQTVAALIFVGDVVEETPAEVIGKVGALADAGVRCFLFQEGDDTRSGDVFGRIARMTGGAHCKFDLGSPEVLRNLLGAVAAWAAGGVEALADLRTPEARLLSSQVG